MACLREGIIDTEDNLDAGMIFGTGFAPFRGGPLHYVHSVGVETIRERLGELEQQFGERFTADEGWSQLAG